MRRDWRAVSNFVRLLFALIVGLGLVACLLSLLPQTTEWLGQITFVAVHLELGLIIAFATCLALALYLFVEWTRSEPFIGGHIGATIRVLVAAVVIMIALGFTGMAVASAIMEGQLYTLPLAFLGAALVALRIILLINNNKWAGGPLLWMCAAVNYGGIALLEPDQWTFWIVVAALCVLCLAIDLSQVIYTSLPEPKTVGDRIALAHATILSLTFLGLLWYAAETRLMRVQTVGTAQAEQVAEDMVGAHASLWITDPIWRVESAKKTGLLPKECPLEDDVLVLQIRNYGDNHAIDVAASAGWIPTGVESFPALSELMDLSFAPGPGDMKTSIQQLNGLLYYNWHTPSIAPGDSVWLYFPLWAGVLVPDDVSAHHSITITWWLPNYVQAIVVVPVSFGADGFFHPVHPYLIIVSQSDLGIS